MDKHENFMDPQGLKGRLLKRLWKIYGDHYDINNTCTWYPIVVVCHASWILKNFSY